MYDRGHYVPGLYRVYGIDDHIGMCNGQNEYGAAQNVDIINKDW